MRVELRRPRSSVQTEMSSPSTWKHKNGRKSEFDWSSRRSSDRPCSSPTSFTRDRCWLAHLGAVLLDLALLVRVRLPGLETADHAGRGAAGVDNRLVGDGKHLDQPEERGKKSNPGTNVGRNQDLGIGFGDI